MARLLTFTCLSFSAVGATSEIEGSQQCAGKAGPSREQVLLQFAGTRVTKPVALADSPDDEEKAAAWEAWQIKMEDLVAEGAEILKHATVQQNATAQQCQCEGAVGRRRRQETKTCRRRHSSSSQDPAKADIDSPSDPWQCNEAEDIMECTAGCTKEAKKSKPALKHTVLTRGLGAPSAKDVGATSSKNIHASEQGANESEKASRGTASGDVDATASTSVPVSGKIGWPSDGRTKAADLWCKINVPSSSWNLKHCPTDGGLKVKVLSYNLFWWNLFDRHGGGGKSAGKLIARTEGGDLYDFMGFQECDSRGRVMAEAQSSGLVGNYNTIDGGKAIAMAYLKTRWTLLEKGRENVGEDSKSQYYGKRSLVWARFQHLETNKTVFFGNHHGPLRVSEGGGCTGSATALNMMKVIAENADVNDAIVLTGDFNAARGSSRVKELERRLVRAFSGKAIGGIDHVFTNCGEGASGRILGKGDGDYKSDHDALSVALRI